MSNEKNTDVTALVPTGEIQPQEKSVADLTQSEIQVIRDTYAKGASDAEFNVYMATCRHRELNPLKGEVHFMKFDTKKGPQMIIVVGIYGLLKIAERGGKYKSRTQYLWCGPDGKWVEFWDGPDNPIAAKVGVYRTDSDIPTVGIATWQEYGKTTEMWRSMPARMLAKCALAQAVREACPEVEGVKIAEEFGTTIENLNQRVSTQTPMGTANRAATVAGFSANDICTFGRKHSGNPWADIPPEYLEWIIGNVDNKPDVTARAQYEINLRAGKIPVVAADENGEIKEADFDDLPPDIDFLRNKIAAMRKSAPKEAVAEIIGRLGDPTMVTDPMILQEIVNEIKGTFEGAGGL